MVLQAQLNRWRYPFTLSAYMSSSDEKNSFLESSSLIGQRVSRAFLHLNRFKAISLFPPALTTVEGVVTKVIEDLERQQSVRKVSTSHAVGHVSLLKHCVSFIYKVTALPHHLCKQQQ